MQPNADFEVSVRFESGFVEIRESNVVGNSIVLFGDADEVLVQFSVHVGIVAGSDGVCAAGDGKAEIHMAFAGWICLVLAGFLCGEGCFGLVVKPYQDLPFGVLDIFGSNRSLDFGKIVCLCHVAGLGLSCWSVSFPWRGR